MTNAERIDRNTFFRLIRETVFGGRISQSAVSAINTILDECGRRQLTDTRMIAYVLATVRGEVGPSMLPVSERGKGRGRRYGTPDPRTGETYYGRGWVQLTWYDNYLKQERKLNLPLTAQPDLLMRPDVSAKVLVGGMIEGDFRRGHRLSTYFTPTKTDWLGAREIINGKHRSSDAYADKAEQFAVWARQFHHALERATVPLETPQALTKREAVVGGAVAAGSGVAVVGTQIAESVETTTSGSQVIETVDTPTSGPQVSETVKTTTASPQVSETGETATAGLEVSKTAETTASPQVGEAVEMAVASPQTAEGADTGEVSVSSPETVETTGARSPIAEPVESAQDTHTFSNWYVFGIAAGVLIVVGVLFALYARWNRAGRPGWRQA
ncbi:MAG: hypothetical protein QNJ62_14520 [Methyloceanibacter sp.]|nr:hypothetical protein [Methyloceanibacter sp.]